MHGAGQSTRNLFDLIRHELFLEGIASTAFDFIGHGETGGCLKSSSLLQRFKQTCDVIDTLHLSQPLSIVASSMSGYTAIKLIEQYAIQHLILIVPAVYAASAYSIPFNQGFSDIIRKPGSWLHSDAWEILQQFKGKLLIVFAEKDEVVPVEIIHQLYHSASNATSKELHLVPESPHKILAFLDHHPQKFQIVTRSIINVLQS